MSMDFPRAWQIARATSMEAHDELCSYRAYGGGLLCDCHVITKHPEFLDDVLQTVDGLRFTVLRKGRPAASHRHRQPLGPQRLRETREKAKRLGATKPEPTYYVPPWRTAAHWGLQ